MAQKYKSVALDYRATNAVMIAQLASINTFLEGKKLISWDIENEFVGAIYDSVLGGATESELLGFKEASDAVIETAIENRVVIRHRFAGENRYVLVEVEKV